ncbi:two-component system sensor histidine kinase NtrB [Haloglomus litoreum]|uniref:two-component system sensor histidine kinase NtrB n=1 Tax=Haloglomus litoreum TaxID=3034026 RepID=UPI0023E8C633|nr:PAS domain-containing sensor histidine kinase [Haloglomus sp. DT116]
MGTESGGADEGGQDGRGGRFEDAIEQTAHAVYITDTEGVIEYVNPAFEELTGYSESEALGRRTSLLQSGEHDQTFYEELWDTILDGEQWEAEIVDETRDGDQVILDQTISPLTTEDGEVERFVAVAQDVTDRKSRQRRLEEQRDDLELLNQVLRHDMRNDLQLVMAYADLLADHVDEEGREYLAAIDESVENAVELTTTARNLSEVILQSNVENTSVPLGMVVEQQIEEIRGTHQDASVRVDGSLPSVRVVANSMLGSVFRNVLKNAIQHNDEAVAEVVVSATADADRVTVRVADNGPGVPDEHKEVVFGKGEKGLESAGTGIGLYLVQSLVDSYGGDVWIEDNDPDGAVFVIELQRA